MSNHQPKSVSNARINKRIAPGIPTASGIREEFRELAAKGELPKGTNLSTADRIRFGYFRARYLLGDDRMAESLGKSTKQIRRYVEGDDFPFAFLKSLSEATGIPVGWFVEEHIEDRKVPDPYWATGVTIPRYDVRASAGAGALVVSENIDEYFAVGRDWLRRNLPPWAPSNAVVGILEGMGDSMEPTIHDGDLIMVVQDVDWRVVERGGIFVFSLDHDRLLLKRLQVLNNGDLKIISDNKNYDPDLVPFDDIHDRVRVHGLVFFAGGKPRSYY